MADEERLLRKEARKLMADQRTALFRALLKREGVPEPVREHLFAKPERAWRFDFAWPDKKLAVEVEGGVYVQGRHTRGAGFAEDMNKYNRATIMGWRILRFMPTQLDTLATVAMIRDALAL